MRNRRDKVRRKIKRTRENRGRNASLSPVGFEQRRLRTALLTGVYRTSIPDEESASERESDVQNNSHRALFDRSRNQAGRASCLCSRVLDLGEISLIASKSRRRRCRPSSGRWMHPAPRPADTTARTSPVAINKLILQPGGDRGLAFTCIPL